MTDFKHIPPLASVGTVRPARKQDSNDNRRRPRSQQTPREGEREESDNPRRSAARGTGPGRPGREAPDPQDGRENGTQPPAAGGKKGRRVDIRV